jgi:nucleoside-diphosphate-sugar epimerase
MNPALAERVRPLLAGAGLDAVEVPLALVGANAGALPLAGALASAEGAADSGSALSAVVLLSNAIVYGAWPDNPVPLADDAPLRPNPGFFPAVVLAEAERVMADWAASHPAVAVAVLRPAVMVGAGWSQVDRAVTGLGGPRAGDLGRPVQFVHVDDVASAVALAADLRLRGVFNVAPDGWIAEETAGELVGGVSRLSLPGRAVRLLALAARRLDRGHLRVRALPYAIHPWVVANDRLRAAGWTPRHSSEEALIDGVTSRRRQPGAILLRRRRG